MSDAEQSTAPPQTVPPTAAPPPQQYDESHLDRLNDVLHQFAGSSGLAGALPDVGRPEQVGPYTILELIGEGGMGSVFKAEQRRPVRRTVALKLVKPGLDTKVVLVRFEAERQALARMDHANIAKVLDAGADHFGRPYFVMEYADGKPITKFADEHKLGIRERLELFCQVCDAIAHAHTKAILHRDIKSSNVLAYMNDGRPTIKVIDFGVAKAITGDRLTDISFSTDRGVVIGTYDSMSPEQADGSPDIDTRSDVYSLGVLLYELLTGVKPFDKETLTRANDQELRRIIREVEPPRPSARLTQSSDKTRAGVAESRAMRSDTLVRTLRSELEWIPMMALRKSRDRRYSSATALADDVRSYLAGRPLVAGPESRMYVARKFVRRHRASVIGTAAAIALVIAGVSFYLHRIREEQRNTLAALREAEFQTEVALEAKNFLASMLMSSRVSRGKPPLVIDVLRAAVKNVDTSFKDRPTVQAQLRTTLGESLEALGENEEALEQFEKALATRRKLWGPDASLSIASEADIGETLLAMGRAEEAEEHFRENLRRCLKYFKPDDDKLLRARYNLGNALLSLRKFEEAEPLLREVYERRLKKFGADDRETLRAAVRVGALLKNLGRGAESESMLRDAMQGLRRVEGEESAELAAVQNALAVMLMQSERYDEAEPYLRASLAFNRKVSPDGNQLIILISNLSKLTHLQGKFDEAITLSREAWDLAVKAYGPDHNYTLRQQQGVRRILVDAGQTQQAVEVGRDLLERRRRLVGPDHAETREAMRGLAAALVRNKKFDEARSLLHEVRDDSRRTVGDEDRDTLQVHADIAGLEREQKNYAVAETEYRALLEIAARNPSALPAKEAARHRTMYAVCIKEQNRFDEAKREFAAALDALRATGQMKTPTARSAVRSLIDIAEKEGNAPEVERLRNELQAITPTTQPSTAPTTRSTDP